MVKRRKHTFTFNPPKRHKSASAFRRNPWGTHSVPPGKPVNALGGGKWKRYAGAAAGAALGAIAGNVPGAVAGAKLGFAAGKKFEFRAQPRRLGVATGVYVGKFKKPKRKFGGKKEAVSLKKGYEVYDETWGAINDPHCVYVGHSTQHLDAIVEAITGGLLRKLFRKAGIVINNSDQELPLQYYNNSIGMAIVFQTRSSTTSALPNPPTMDYQIPNNETWKTLLSNVTNMKQYFKDYITNYSTDKTPYMLSLYSFDTYGVAQVAYRLSSQMNLENEVVHLNLWSQLMVQNRTQGQTASAGDMTLERLDNQPLSGWLYEFKHGTARMRQSGATGTDVIASNNAQFADFKTNGVRLIRSAEVDADYQDPPNPRIFGNLAKASKIMLNPGQMKRVTISHKFVNKLPTLLNKLKAQCEYISGFWTLIPGKSQFVALQESLRTSSSNPIYLNYEIRKKIGAYCVTKQKDYLLPHATNTQFNNTT